ncbi:HAMP domain-containing protein [Tateyamaria omphalii]|uniref:HAMP domain-containing protein n=1 Tax=Tateyamaria omphalii TaxID=299262 RepID=A0A1P8MVS0_9RHOB|nr:HAMP domain-containing protein [Tateyamaria omphalii]APX12165.1 hypothetical protein BWR18_11100 [Tateyamaria omphalii]
MTELTEDSAYAVANAITRQVLITGALGFALASIGALIFARRLARPILAIGETVERMGAGDFAARVDDVNSHDEIGQLSRRVNTMISELGERLQLMKFVRQGTVSAIQNADAGVSRGGERKRVSVIFTDIRGYTAFSKRVAPEVVIEALNEYSRCRPRSSTPIMATSTSSSATHWWRCSKATRWSGAPSVVRSK